jgi:hypothetical protein
LEDRYAGTIETVVFIDINDNGKIKRINVTDASLYQYITDIAPNTAVSPDDGQQDTFDFYDWNASDFITAKPFKDYISTIKNQLIGQPIASIHSMGCIFNNWDNEDFETWDSNGWLNLDEPIAIYVGGVHLDICFENTSHTKIGVNTLRKCN